LGGGSTWFRTRHDKRASGCIVPFRAPTSSFTREKGTGSWAVLSTRTIDKNVGAIVLIEHGRLDKAVAHGGAEEFFQRLRDWRDTAAFPEDRFQKAASGQAAVLHHT
jgi:hypothetical protein